MPPIRSTTTVELATRPPVVLPNEILDVILDNLGDHKPTFAKCMRISLQMYQVVAPRLYTNLTWDNTLSYPFVHLRSPKSTSKRIKRISPGKDKLLETLIRTFRIENHSNCKCSHKRSYERYHRLRNIIEIPVLAYIATGAGQDIGGQNHLDVPRSSCHIISRIKPTKLVLRASPLEPLPIRDILRDNLAKVVTCLSLENQLYLQPRKQHRQPFGKESPAQRMVVYFITAMYQDDYEPQCFGKRSVVAFVEHLMEVLYKPQFADKVVVVNGARRSKNSDGQKDHCCDKRFAKLESDFQRAAKEMLLKIRAYWEGKSGGPSLYKTVQRAGATRVRFIDSREYFEGFDTTGEFTDDERKLYLGEPKGKE